MYGYIKVLTKKVTASVLMVGSKCHRQVSASLSLLSERS